ncbi:MAG: hypothetical protein NTZ09_18660 [Candidatus Hydrogenedentes bacterium]|nr:hypothetical protein [Candidatus Hydrogenedentota bacterium]
MDTRIDVFGLFGVNIIEEVQDFFGSIVAWILGLVEDLTGIDLVDD